MVPWSSLAFAWQTKFSIDASVSGMLLTVSDGSAGEGGGLLLTVRYPIHSRTPPIQKAMKYQVLVRRSW